MVESSSHNSSIRILQIVGCDIIHEKHSSAIVNIFSKNSEINQNLPLDNTELIFFFTFKDTSVSLKIN